MWEQQPLIGAASGEAWVAQMAGIRGPRPSQQPVTDVSGRSTLTGTARKAFAEYLLHVLLSYHALLSYYFSSLVLKTRNMV